MITKGRRQSPRVEVHKKRTLGASPKMFLVPTPRNVKPNDRARYANQKKKGEESNHLRDPAPLSSQTIYQSDLETLRQSMLNASSSEAIRRGRRLKDNSNFKGKPQTFKKDK